MLDLTDEVDNVAIEASRGGARPMLGICSVGELTRSSGWWVEALACQTLLGVAGTFAFSAMLHL